MKIRLYVRIWTVNLLWLAVVKNLGPCEYTWYLDKGRWSHAHRVCRNLCSNTVLLPSVKSNFDTDVQFFSYKSYYILSIVFSLYTISVGFLFIHFVLWENVEATQVLLKCRHYPRFPRCPSLLCFIVNSSTIWSFLMDRLLHPLSLSFSFIPVIIFAMVT